MIIVCSGDSFTHGMELWEEQNVPGYTKIKNQKDAFAIKNTSLKIEDERLALTWPKHLGDIVNCQIINIAEDGGSEHSITQKTIETLGILRKTKPHEEIVCIVQDTQLERIWIWCREFEKNINVLMSGTETFYPGDELAGYELKNIFMTNQTNELILSEYYLQSLSVKHFCDAAGIRFFHFQMFKDWKDDSNLNYNIEFSKLESTYYDIKHMMRDNMASTLIQYYGHNNFVLPGLHVNCEAQKIIAKKVFNELKIRNIL